MKIYSVSKLVFLTVILLAQKNIAQVKTHFTAQLPWTFVQEKIQSELKRQSSITQTLNQFNFVASDITWYARGIQATANLNSVSIVTQPSYLLLDLPQFQSQIRIAELYADQIITREVGGIIFEIRFQATCGPFLLEQNQAVAKSVFNPNWNIVNPAIDMTSIDLKWPEKSWKLSAFNCQGPQGISDLVKSEIQKYLENPTFAQTQIQGFIQSYVKEKVLQSFTQTISQFPIKIGNKSQTGFVTDSSAQPSGLFLGVTTDRKNPNKISAETLSLGAFLTGTGPHVITTMDDLKQLIRTGLNSKDDIVTIDLQKIPSFKELMNSPFQQFWAWPDLQNYQPTSPFFAYLKIPENLRMTQTRDQYKMRIDLEGIIKSFRDKTWWNYINYKGPIETLVSVSFKSGIMQYQTEVTKSEIRFQMTPEYIKKFSTDSQLPEKAMNDGFLGQQKDLSGQVQWPVFLGENNAKFEASALNKINSKYIYLQWSRK